VANTCGTARDMACDIYFEVDGGTGCWVKCLGYSVASRDLEACIKYMYRCM